MINSITPVKANKIILIRPNMFIKKFSPLQQKKKSGNPENRKDSDFHQIMVYEPVFILNFQSYSYW